jgi:hypothetical protein
MSAARTKPRPTKGTLGRLEKQLTGQHELFIEALVVGRSSIKDAAIAAGVSSKNASSMGCQWLNSDKYPQIAHAIEKRREYLRNTSDVDAKRIMQELARIGLFDPRRILRPDGKGVIDLKDMPDDVAAVISNINVSYGEAVDGDGNYTVLKNIRFSFHDKLTALNQLSGMLGLNNGGATTVINNNTTNNLILDWNKLYNKAKQLPASDPIEARILAEEGREPRMVVATETNEEEDKA